MSELLNDRMKEITIQRYVCARCWGHLIAFPEDGGWRVECAKYGDEHAGYVTCHYADKRRESSVAEAWEVKDNLESLGVIQNPHKGKSSNQLLEELGF